MSEIYLGREVLSRQTFNVKGDFDSLWAAQGWCSQNGYSYGSLCGPKPQTPIQKGEYTLPQKIINCSKDDILKMDGVIHYVERGGEAIVILFKPKC